MSKNPCCFSVEVNGECLFDGQCPCPPSIGDIIIDSVNADIAGGVREYKVVGRKWHQAEESWPKSGSHFEGQWNGCDLCEVELICVPHTQAVTEDKPGHAGGIKCEVK
jgi:hypothetical protein